MENKSSPLQLAVDGTASCCPFLLPHVMTVAMGMMVAEASFIQIAFHYGQIGYFGPHSKSQQHGTR